MQLKPPGLCRVGSGTHSVLRSQGIEECQTTPVDWKQAKKQHRQIIVLPIQDGKIHTDDDGG
jgi:hypothetical protein